MCDVCVRTVRGSTTAARYPESKREARLPKTKDPSLPSKDCSKFQVPSRSRSSVINSSKNSSGQRCQNSKPHWGSTVLITSPTKSNLSSQDQLSAMSAWGTNSAVAATVAPISFKFIVEQQEANTDSAQVGTDQTELDVCQQDEEVCQGDFMTDEFNDDLKLAQLLQQLENDDSLSSYEEKMLHDRNKCLDQNSFSKISVVSRYDSSSTNQNRLYQGTRATSSDYLEATHRENQLNSVVDGGNIAMFRGGVTMLPDGEFVSKHDSLLNSLSNSVKLTEIDGVGDLSAAGILIGNSVANSIKSANSTRSSALKKKCK